MTNYPRTIETKEGPVVVNNFKEFRNQVRINLNKTTFHGIPSSEQAFGNLAASLELNGLSKGHLSDKHQASHNTVVDPDKVTTADERITTACKKWEEKTGMKIRYEPRWRSRLAASRDNDSKYERVLRTGGSGRLFSQMMRKSPYNKRGKLIRPLRIVLEKLSPTQYELYKKVGKKNGNNQTPQWRKKKDTRGVALKGSMTHSNSPRRFERPRHATLRTQVVHPAK